MRYLYDLNLNHRDLIQSKVTELCREDLLLSESCKDQMVSLDIIRLLSDVIINSLFTCRDSYPDSFELDFDEAAGAISADLLSQFLLRGISIRHLIVVLKHFKNCINEVIINNENQDIYQYISMNVVFFDRLELMLYNYCEEIKRVDVLLKKVFELTPFGVFILENDQITYANRIGEIITGYSNEELRTKSLSDIIHPDSVDILSKDVSRWKSNNGAIGNIYECKIINKQGYDLWLQVSAVKTALSSKPCIIGTAINITDSRKLDELKRQSAENVRLLNEVIEHDKIRTEFFSNLSHELRTPLNVILGTLQLVDMYSNQPMNAVSEKTKKYYKIMRQNCYRLLRQVNNLIDLNKLDAGYIHMNVDNYDIVSIVSQIAASVTDYIQDKGIRFEYTAISGSRIIACDPDKIERVLLNLLSNAVKFTDSGGKIEVKLWDKDNELFISVKDSGIGIPKDKQDMVFQRFAQIEKSLCRNHQGSGIGLSIVKSMVEMHGGSISLISEAGLGAEFIVKLPIKQTQAMENPNEELQYSNNNRIEVINIEFADIYS